MVAPLRVDATLDISKMKRDLNAIERKLIPRAAANALNKTGIAARKVADQTIRQRFNLKSQVVKANIVIRRAGANRLIVYIDASGNPIALRDYSARMTRKGATYRVTKVRGRRVYKRKGVSAFILDRFGGHVFVRIEPDPPGVKKGRIKKVFGPSLPQYFVSRIVRKAMERTIRDVWPKRFGEEMNFQLLRARGQL